MRVARRLHRGNNVAQMGLHDRVKTNNVFLDVGVAGIEEVDCTSDPSDEMGEQGMVRGDLGNRNRRLNSSAKLVTLGFCDMRPADDGCTYTM